MDELIKRNKEGIEFLGWQVKDGIVRLPETAVITKSGETYNAVLLEDLLFDSNWDWLIFLYNRCLNQAKRIKPDEDNFIALNALKTALSPNLNGQLDIKRAFMCINDFTSYFNKIKHKPQ